MASHSCGKLAAVSATYCRQEVEPRSGAPVVEGGLESVLVEPLRPEYRELVEAARKRIRQQG